jgi:nucleotide-binding universal stress UspA family protein
MPETAPRILAEALSDAERRTDQLTSRGPEQASRAPGGAATAAVPTHPPLALRRVLAAIDGSSHTSHVLDWAGRFAETFGSEVDLLTVVPPSAAFDYALWEGPSSADFQQAEEEGARRLLADARRVLRARGVHAESAVEAGSPGRVIAARAAATGADVVVVGAHGRGAVGRLLLGSVADDVRHQVPVDVLVAKDRARVRRIIAATDGSAPSRRAVALALRLGQAWDAHVTILHALPPPTFGPIEPGRRAFEHAFGRLDLASWRHPRVTYDLQFGPPAERIVAAARSGAADLVVLGNRGLGGATEILGGSVSSRVAHEAPCSVLLVKQPPVAAGIRGGGP